MTPEGPETVTPAIPAQRAPSDAGYEPPAAPPPEPEKPRRSKGKALVAAGSALGVLALGFVVLRPDAEPTDAAVAATSAPAAPSAPSAPYDLAVAALTAQSEALLRGDESAWLAAVDSSKTGLRTRYRQLFRSLRALGVTRYAYRPGVGQPVKGDASAMSMRVDIGYCFGAEMCPESAATEWAKPPYISQKIVVKPAADGRYVISDLGASPQKEPRQPLPWESGDLTFAQGKRVTVAAAAGQQKHLQRVLAAAEAAAVVDDRYAAMLGTTPSRYRIFLAGEKQWKSWYGGNDSAWAIGLAVPLNMRGIDVVLRMKEMTDARVLRLTLQHELGHVITLSGAFRADAAEDTWLSEGIAEYIGWKPTSAAGSLRLSSVRWQLNRKAAKSMVPALPGARSSDRAGDAFYGLSHFAADCMAKKYGERKLFDFVRLVLTQDNEYDQAARDAYGVPFAAVDKHCVKWIREQSR
ncbi:hypothetical protein [Paractinoplanes rishiriensis]|uniref:Peptidase MA superfamily n=1 Tax=Paractinoplanes rishiriensis TaxID=1050105 RepID=A0A919K1K3_9ACTN|nr:hypothetical protein [Actinoplanes rishiriensis]GIE97144.1 hypothetical protein Ari01nite_46090 [Actinoplanes rishiriensis]